MRILQVIKSLDPSGGVGVYVNRLLRLLSTAGHEVHVLYSSGNLPAGVTGHRVEGFDEDIEGRIDPDKTNEALRIATRLDFDVVHVQNNNNLELERKIFSRMPSVKMFHVYDFCPSGAKYHFALKQVCGHRAGIACIPRMAYKRCTNSWNPKVILRFSKRAAAVARQRDLPERWLTASEYVKREAVHTAGFDPDKIDVLPYFAEISGAKTAAQPGTMLFAGRLFPEKGLDVLIRACASVSKNLSWQLLVAGDGPERKKNEELARHLGVSERVRFLGWVTDEGCADLYRKASFVVVPSLWPEPFGIVGIDAMSHSKPAVAFRAGGIPEWLEDGKTGFLAEPNDERDLARKIEMLLRDPELAARFGEAGRLVAERRFSGGAHLERLAAIYERAKRSFRRGEHARV